MAILKNAIYSKKKRKEKKKKVLSFGPNQTVEVGLNSSAKICCLLSFREFELMDQQKLLWLSVGLEAQG